MAFDEVLADRMREMLEPLGAFHGMKMFGGLAFMRRGHMCCGLYKGGLILRLGPEGSAAAIAAGEAQAFRPVKGKAQSGMVVVPEPEALDDEPLQRWLNLAAAFVDTLPPKPLK